MGPKEDTVEVLFPTNGIDTSGEFGVQRPNTSPSAVNVRSCDPLQERMRGGSRHGLIKFIDDELPNSEAFVDNFTSPGSATWTAPLSITDTVKIECWGGGGGAGGGEAGSSKASGGGGGGEYARVDAFVAVAGGAYAYVVGADGTAGGDGQDGSPGGDSSFNSTSCIAIGGSGGATGVGAGTGLGGAGGTGGTGDFTFDGGSGGSGDTGTGGAGGGGSGGTNGDGFDGDDGQPLFFGGPGGAAGTAGGDGGAGATSDPGNESLASDGVGPGGGGGGAATDAGGTDPTYLSGKDGAAGQVRITYRQASPMQHLAQLVTYNADFLGSSFEYYSPDFIPDPSTNNGGTTRNPGRDIPPGGAGDPPSRTRPLINRRRIQAVAAPTAQVNGINVTVTSTLTALPGSTAVGSVLVRMRTVPRGRDGDGDSATTTGLGIGVFTVNEPTYEGLITYITQHQYVNATTGQPATVTGYTQVVWRPNYTLTLVSTDGTALDVASGNHPLVASLTRTTTGAAIKGRRISLRTNPAGRVADKLQKFTNGSGQAVFQVSSPVAEAVAYTASLIPTANNPSSITATETITWSLPPIPPVPPLPPPPPPGPQPTTEWRVDNSEYYSTIQGKDYFIYTVQLYSNGTPVVGTYFTILESEGTNVICCLPAIRMFGGPGIPGLYGRTMNGADCPLTTTENDAYVFANCVGL